MAQYKIVSDNCSLADKGSVIEDQALEGFNVDALIQGGHIVEITAKVSKEQEK
jgi:hypothetical protein